MRAEDLHQADLEKKKAERTVQKEDGTEQVLCTALVVAEKKDAIEQWLEKEGIKFGKAKAARARTGEYDHDAAMAGNNAAKDINLSFGKQVSAGAKTPQIGA